MKKKVRRKINKVLFPKEKDLGKRIWGKEKLLAHIPKILTLKRLEIKKGQKGGLQYHRKKNECGYLLSGKLIVRYDKGNGKLVKKILKAGSIFHFPPGAVHQEEALSNCIIIEASTPHFNDRVRVEKKYGIFYNKGLPTTLKKDIAFK
tara:strand:- start:290 stop:733 length:444 start_codon:yes stop_codon:yes gene_type:complete